MAREMAKITPDIPLIAGERGREERGFMGRNETLHLPFRIKWKGSLHGTAVRAEQPKGERPERGRRG
jgi:hypothetical protein